MDLNVTGEHGSDNKGTTDNKDEDIIYEVSAQISLGHGDGE